MTTRYVTKLSKSSYWYQSDRPPGTPEVVELQQAYKDHGIKLNYKQAKRLWDIFRDCNVSTLIF